MVHQAPVVVVVEVMVEVQTLWELRDLRVQLDLLDHKAKLAHLVHED